MVESKSLKLYLFSFRNHGDFHEDCVNIIMKMVTESMPPDSTIMESLFMGISHCEWECRESACFNEVLAACTKSS